MKTGLEIHRQMYRTMCDTYTASLDEAKAAYYKAKISNSNNQQLFQLIDSLFKVKATPPLPSCDSLPELAEAFSNYFHQKIKTMREDLEKSKMLSEEPSVSVNPVPSQASFLEFAPVTESYICNLLKKSPAKSCQLDPVPTRILKQDLDLLVPTITKIIITSLTEGVVPSALKKGITFPSLKKTKTDKEEFPNYRPITNTPFLSKSLERVVSTQTTNYLSENDLFAKHQSAYRLFHSTETAMLRVTNDLLREIDSGNEVVLVLLDLSAAFDTIDHTLLLERLEHRYGFGGSVLAWFQSYITNREQSIVVRDVVSTAKPLQYGVPQGSVLGPLLFSLYFAPLEDVIKAHGIKCMMFADDTQLYLSISRTTNRTAILTKLELCVKDILIWCTKNKLACNPSKTEIAHLSSRFKHCELIPSISINNISIEPVPVARDLGITVDSHLTLNSHINSICKGCCLAIRNISRIRKYLNQADCEKLVHSFVTSRLDSCNSILYSLPESQLSKLQRIQNIAARLVTKTKKSDHITPVLRHLHWLPISYRIQYKICLTTFKALNGMAPEYISNLLQQHKPVRSLRSASQNLLSYPVPKSVTYGDRAFSVCAPKLWNSLPYHLRNSNSISSFKSNLKTFLFRKAFN